jgi:benzoate membrane transport protein
VRAPGGRDAVGASVSLVVMFVAFLSIPLAAADDLRLSAAETTGWIVALYGLAGLLSIVLVLRHRQPLLLTGNIFVLIFLSRLSDFTWDELVGACVAAGAVVLVLGRAGLLQRLSAWLPSGIVFALLAGAVLPLVVDMVGRLGESTLVVGGTLGAYLLGVGLLRGRWPAILPALVVGTLLVAVTGGYESPDTLTWPRPELTMPAFSPGALLTATPVVVVLVTLQANVPSVVFLRGEGYRPPERTVTTVTGAGTMLGSLLGPMGLSLSLPATAVVAGPGAGPREGRWRAALYASVGGVVVAVLGGLVASDLAVVVPRALLSVLVGLAVLPVLMTSLQHVAAGPLVLGPVLTLAVSLSDLSLLGLGPFFWALVLGLVVSRLLEREAWGRVQGAADEPR